MTRKWEQAVRKSIIISGLGMVLMGLVLPAENFADIFIGHPIFVIPFFFIISMLGWFFIGIPCHWLINRFTNGSALYYVFASLIVSVAFILFVKDRFGFVLGLLAVVQCLIFIYYLKSESNISLQEST